MRSLVYPDAVGIAWSSRLRRLVEQKSGPDAILYLATRGRWVGPPLRVARRLGILLFSGFHTNSSITR